MFRLVGNNEEIGRIKGNLQKFLKEDEGIS